MADIAPVSVTPGNDQADLAAAQGVAKAIVGKAAGPVGYGAGQNPFAAAANNVDQQKAQMLQALAAGGSAGRALLDQANAGLAAQRQEAIKGALAASATRGVGAGLGAQAPAMEGLIGGIVGSPGQQYGADLSGAARDFTENNGYLQQGYNTYANEAKAAVPVIEANTQAGLQAKRMETLAKMASDYQSGVGKLQQAADTQQANDALKNLSLQIANANLTKAETTGQTAQTNLSKAQTTAAAATAGGALKGLAATVNQSATALGIAPAEVSKLQTLDNGKSWKAGVAAYEAGLANGETMDQVTQNVQAAFQKAFGNKHPEMVALLQSMYGSAYQKNGLASLSRAANAALPTTPSGG